MRARQWFLGLSFLVLAALPTQAADLAKIERVIAKEPKYEGKPEYCLLVFGPEAKFRVWLVLDGKVLYVDRNGNGDLTQPDKRMTPSGGGGGWFAFRPGAIGTPDGKTKYYFNRLQKCEDGARSASAWKMAPSPMRAPVAPAPCDSPSGQRTLPSFTSWDH
jgi:hypothetical protein